MDEKALPTAACGEKEKDQTARTRKGSETNLSSVTLPKLKPGKEYLGVISVLESLSDPKYTTSQRVNKVLKISPWLTVPEVGLYVKKYPEKLGALLLEMQQIG